MVRGTYLPSTIHNSPLGAQSTSIAFEAEQFTRKQDGAEVEWTIIPELGRTLSGLTTQPVTAAVDGAWVEYDFTSTESDSARVIVRLAPTLNYIPEGQRLALRLDGEETVININGHYRGELGQWQQDHIIDIEASFACPVGQHTLRLTPLDNGIVMEKIMIDLGDLQPSFLGPPSTIALRAHYPQSTIALRAHNPLNTWTCAPQWLYNIPPLAHQCLTQRVHVSVGGDGLALTLTNRFGESVLSFDSVFVDNQPMLFNGQQAVAIAAGQDLTSDWMPYPVQALDTLTITLYYNEVPATLTGHSGSRTTSYLSTIAGTAHNSPSGAPSTIHQWVSILNLQTSNPDAHLWAALGNSITDGRGSTTDAQNRWTDIASTITIHNSPSGAQSTNIGFLNLGIGGNCVTGGGLGPTAAERFERDILQQVGVEGVIIYIGVNDIGNAVDTDATLISLKKHFTRFFALAHEHGLPVLVCTITPFEGHAYYTPEHEQLRQRFNAWLRTETLVEGVIDLDKVLADPAHPMAIPAALQDNDGLHPSALGYQKIGKTIANYILTMDNSHSSAMNSTIDELYNRMTLEERVAQLHGQHLGDYFHKNGKLNTAKCKRDLLHGAGHFSQFAVTHHATPDEMLHKVQVMQQWLQQHNRLYIPALFHEEVLSGVAAYGATVYPQQIGLACSFNPALAEQKTFQTATDLRMIGGLLALSPMVDVIRDPSFNRLEESYGEDAYLSSAMGVAFVKGLQHGNLNEGVAACTKHYLGYGGGGLAPLKERMEDILMPHEAIMRLANSQALMPAYHSVDGVKMIANRHWLTDIARDYLHFDGVVVSDYGAIEQNEAEPDIVHQTAAALKAGNDVDFPDGNAYKYLPQALEQGLITEADIERAVKAVLRLKYRLGLLDNRQQAATPLLPYTSTPIKWDRPEEQQTAYELATQSVVLLQNKGVLPLQPNQKIALVGPNANSMWAMLGDYTYHSMRYFWQRKEEDALHPVIHTLLEGMQQHLPEGSTLAYSRGCDWTETLETVIEEGGDERARYMRSIQGRTVKNNDPIDRQEALRLASESDVIIAAMGENVMLCGENRDRTSLRLPGSQEQFVRELIATGKPVVLVLFGGRAQVISAIAHDCAAVLQAWYPGEMGGLAVADLLYGKRVPSGKLSVTYPAVEMHEPICYNYGLLPSDERVAWPFGYGLSYTTFDYNHLTLPQEVKTNSEHFDLSVEVTNTGSVAADEIIQVYISPLDRSMKHKPIQLQGFARVTLQPNETKRVQWRLFTEQLGYWSPDGWCIDPGRFVIKVGASSQDIRLEQELQLTGPECTKPLREHYLSELITVYPL